MKGEKELKDLKKNENSFYSDTRKTIRILFVTLSFIGAFAWANLGLNLFTPGTTISSNDVNTNFEILEKAIISNLVIKNQAPDTLIDPNSCKYPAEVINLDVSGSDVTNYNTSTGEFTFSENGMYEVIYLMNCNSCSKVYVYLCSDDGQVTGACINDSKAVKTNIGEINSGNTFGLSKYINVDSGKTYKLVANLCGDVDFSNAEDFQIYFKKVR